MPPSAPTATTPASRLAEAHGVPLEGHAGIAVPTSYSPDGTLLATSGTDGRVVVRDAETGRQFGTPLAASDNTYTMANFDPDGRLLVASADGAMWLWGHGPAFLA